MIDQGALNAYLGSVSKRFNGADAHAVLTRFMCRCLLLVQHLLPPVGRKAFETAMTYWLEGEPNSAALQTARIDCWEYLNAKGRSTDILNREDAAMRALICVLYAEPDSDDFSVETVRWFVSLLDRLGDFSREILPLMQIR